MENLYCSDAGTLAGSFRSRPCQENFGLVTGRQSTAIPGSRFADTNGQPSNL
jgi:hypothetical protein